MHHEVSTAPWRVQMFGSFRVMRGEAEAAFRTKKTAGLLAYLAFYRGRRISKDLLVDALWPEADADKGRHSLRMAVSSLRASFEAPGWDPAAHINSDRETIELSEGGFTSDVHEFRQLIKSKDNRLANLAEAVDLYTGPFLSGFNDEWILPQALEYEEAYAQAVCELIALMTQAGKVKEAVVQGRRAIGLCPNREDLHIAIMRAYAESGQSGLALKQYEELEQMLDDVWGEAPSEEAIEILESLPRRTPGGPKPVISSTVMVESESPRTSFFGRERELVQLKELLDGDAKLVTLVGLGGSGKTRLAQRLAQDFDSRVWFISLVSIEGAEQLHEAILSALDWQPVSGSDVLGTVADKIGTAPALLLLDNLEQIVPAARAAIGQLLKSCPGLRVLATSRIPLDASGERLFPVAPLDLPTDFRDLGTLRNAPSVQLLVDAAQGVRPGFAVTTGNAQSVLILCQRLEGIPLAIELAAAKLGTLTPAQVIASIARRVDLGTTKAVFREQHRSLRTVVEWSLGLLTERERKSFARLGVCRGGFNHALAVALLGDAAEEDVAQLCRYSLVGWSESPEEVRFEMLETVREMSHSLLSEGELKAVLAQHFEYVRSVCDDPLRTEDASAWVARIGADIANVYAAIETATSGLVDPGKAWSLTFPLEDYIERTGRPQVWIHPFEGLLAATKGQLDPATLARAHALLAVTHYGRREIRQTFDHYLAAIKASDQTDDTILRIDLRTHSISSAITLGDFDTAQRHLEEATKLLAGTEDKKAAALCYLNLGWVIFDRGNEEDSVADFRRATELAEECGDITTLAASLTGLGCGLGHSDYEASQPIFDRAMDLWQSTGHHARIAHHLYYRGLIDYRHGKLEASLDNIRTSLRMFVDNGIALGQSSMTICGTTLAALGHHETAAMSWGRAEAARKRQQMLPIPCLQRDVDREEPATRRALSPESFKNALARAVDMTGPEFVDALFGPNPSA